MTTPDTPLRGKRILVVEDEYFIAKSLARDLQQAGADVLGPVPTVADAMALIDAGSVDAAVLDVNLRGEMAYPVADALTERRVPFVLATGYSADALPVRYASLPRCDKPVAADALVAALFPG